MDLEGEIDCSKIKARDFNTPLSIIGGTTRPNVKIEIEDLNNTMHKLDLRNVHRALHPTVQNARAMHV